MPVLWAGFFLGHTDGGGSDDVGPAAYRAAPATVSQAGRLALSSSSSLLSASNTLRVALK